MRWLADSTGVLILARTENGSAQLFFGDLERKEVTPLTPAGQDVTAFDVRDRAHYVFTVRSKPPASFLEEQTAPAHFATGRSLVDILEPMTHWRCALPS